MNFARGLAQLRGNKCEAVHAIEYEEPADDRIYSVGTSIEFTNGTKLSASSSASGLLMLGAVAAYGCATIAFGLSNHWELAIALLFLIGAADMLSTVIRQSLIQFATPDSMRGRVFAINTLFVNGGGQLGTFESGVTAAWFGPVGSAVVGGAAVLGIVAFWAWRFPDLYRVEGPDDVAHDRHF